MKEVDYIIVGLGIAGVSICRSLDRIGKEYVVFDNGYRNATEVAGGVVNPVVIKRLNPVWRATEFLGYATHFYKELEAALGQQFHRSAEVLRIFSSIEEQNNWTVASDSEKLKGLIDSNPLQNVNPAIITPFGLGRVKGCLQLETSRLITSFRKKLEAAGRLVKSQLDFSQFEQRSDTITVPGYRARKIILAQGVLALRNTPFILDSIVPKKGEYLTFRSKELKLESILKGPFFIIPKGRDIYQTGATFAHGDNTPGITEKGREQMTQALKRMIDVPFEIVDQTVGFRPTVKDRRPIVGRIDEAGKFFILNGLGSRGLLMAPLLSKWLIDHIEHGTQLPAEVDIRRYR